MAITRKPARKAIKRTAAKKVAGRTIRRRSTVSGRATLKAQQTRRAARRGTRVVSTPARKYNSRKVSLTIPARRSLDTDYKRYIQEGLPSDMAKDLVLQKVEYHLNKAKGR